MGLHGCRKTYKITRNYKNILHTINEGYFCKITHNYTFLYKINWILNLCEILKMKYNLGRIEY